MSIDLPEGFAARPATREDAATMLELIVAAEVHYDGIAEVDASDIEMDFGRVGFDLATDCIVVLEDEEPVGWANVYRERAEADVRPSHHRHGIGAAILRWTETRGRETGAAKVAQTVTDNNADAKALFLANGYGPTWTSWILEIAFDESPPEHRPPGGISIRTYEAGDAHDAYRLIDDAFGEWEGRDSMPFEEWATFVIEHQAFAPELSRLAFEGEELVGATLAFDYAKSGEGWVQQVATKATHRHRGIARALLSETFRAFYDRGKARCGLSTESRTGALALYERVGMQVRRSYTKYAKPLN